MADVPIPDPSVFFNKFVTTVEGALHDMFTAFIDGAIPVATAFLLVTFLVIASGTILTVMYIILSALDTNRRRMNI